MNRKSSKRQLTLTAALACRAAINEQLFNRRSHLPTPFPRCLPSPRSLLKPSLHNSSVELAKELVKASGSLSQLLIFPSIKPLKIEARNLSLTLASGGLDAALDLSEKLVVSKVKARNRLLGMRECVELANWCSPKAVGVWHKPLV